MKKVQAWSAQLHTLCCVQRKAPISGNSLGLYDAELME